MHDVLLRYLVWKVFTGRMTLEEGHRIAKACWYPEMN
jgi:hypothetical protein